MILLLLFLQVPCANSVDLTHNFDEQAIYWPTASSFKKTTVFAGETEKGYHYEAFHYEADEHGGTHLDAPVHFYRGSWTADQIPLSSLMGPGCVIDVGEACKDRDYQVTTRDFLEWEKKNGKLPDGAIVLLNTGSAKMWPDRKTYMGTDERGDQAVAKLHFPGLHPHAAKWLVTERNIAAIGLDTPSIDYGQSTEFLAHRILFQKNIPAFENVADMSQLPAKGSWITALPMKIKDGSGAPLRIIACLP